MKQSGLQIQVQDKIQVSHRNRVRLILQNKKLSVEVHKLEEIINTVIQKTAADSFLNMELQQQLRNKCNQDHDQQLRTIVRLKKEIKKVKATLANDRINEVASEQNSLVFLKRQLEKIYSQKNTLIRQKHEKQQALEFHKPINNQTAEILQKYKKLKSQNVQLKLKIHQIEREVGKFHKMKQMAKTSVPKKYENPDYELIKMQNEIVTMKKQMKHIQQKWRGKIQSLDSQYFSFKSILKQKQSCIQNLEKDIKCHQNRMLAMKDEINIINDRERINGIIISPQKRKEMMELIDEERKKIKKLSPNIKEKKDLKIRAPQNSKNKPSQIKLTEIKQTSSQIIKQQLKIQPANKQQHEKAQISNEIVPKMKKITESIGVGTTFYYADD